MTYAQFKEAVVRMTVAEAQEILKNESIEEYESDFVCLVKSTPFFVLGYDNGIYSVPLGLQTYSFCSLSESLEFLWQNVKTYFSSEKPVI